MDPEHVQRVRAGLNGSTQHFILKEEVECMRKGMRFGFTAAEKAEVWDRWREGISA